MRVATNLLNKELIDPNSMDLDRLSRDLCREIETANWEEVLNLITLVPAGQLLPVHIVAAKQTALHLAIENDVEPLILQRLISVMDMNLANQPDKFGNTPLHLCCRRGTHLQSLALIAEAWPNAALQENVRGHIPLDDLFLRDEDDEEPWDPAEATSLLLDACPPVIDHLDLGGQTLLHRIFRHGATEAKICSIPHALLRRQPEFAHAVDSRLVTPLHEACKREDSLPIVQDLMAQLSREQWMVQDDEGRTVLHYAVYWGAPVEIVRELVRASHDFIHVKDLSGKTPMDYLLSFYAPDFTSNNSIQVGWGSFVDNIVDMVRAFFVDGPHRGKTRLGELFLHSALYTKDCPMPIIEFLVVAAPEHAEEYDETGNLPIHLACQLDNIDEANSASHVEVISELVSRFPEGVRAPNPDGLLPLKLMINAGRTWEGGIQTLIEAHPAAICDECLEPYSLTTFLSKLDHDTMYRLLQEAPFLMESGCSIMKL